MSHQAIGTALALDGVTAPQRLVAFSLASYANREDRAWPSAPAAAQRAGLTRGRFLAVRDELVRAGLVVVEDARGGRGCSSTVRLVFATGERFEAEINAPLFEAALTRTAARGGARLLLAVMAALADDHGRLYGVLAGELAAGAGLTATSYRRARGALLESGEVRLDSGAGGRGNANEWTLTLPAAAEPAHGRRRVAARAHARPLLASVTPQAADQRAAASQQTKAEPAIPDGVMRLEKGGATKTVLAVKGAAARTVSAAKGAAVETVWAGKGAVGRTVSPERAPQREPETPPLPARAGREPWNLRAFPPDPPEGGPASRIALVEDYVTDRGRTRQRRVEIDRAALADRYREPTDIDHESWAEIRCELLRVVGESTFEIWLAPLSLRAIEASGGLLIVAPGPTRAWVAKRFGRLFDRIAASTSRAVRLVDDREEQILHALLSAAPSGDTSTVPSTFTDRRTHNKEAV